MEKIKKEKADLYNWVLALSQTAEMIQKENEKQYRIHINEIWYLIAYRKLVGTDWHQDDSLVVQEERIHGLVERTYWNYFPFTQAKELLSFLEKRYQDFNNTFKHSSDQKFTAYRDQIKQIFAQAQQVQKISDQSYCFTYKEKTFRLRVEYGVVSDMTDSCLTITKLSPNNIDAISHIEERINGTKEFFRPILKELDKKAMMKSTLATNILHNLRAFLG